MMRAAVIAACLCAGIAAAGPLVKGTRNGSGSATISNLTAPVASEDGLAIADLANLQGKCGTADGGPYNTAGTLAASNATSVTITGLTSGTWYCVVYGIDNAGQYSGPGQQFSKVVP